MFAQQWSKKIHSCLSIRSNAMPQLWTTFLYRNSSELRAGAMVVVGRGEGGFEGA